MSRRRAIIILLSCTLILSFILLGLYLWWFALRREPPQAAPSSPPSALRRQTQFDSVSDCAPKVDALIRDWAHAHGLVVSSSGIPAQHSWFIVVPPNHFIEAYYQPNVSNRSTELTLSLVPRRTRQFTEASEMNLIWQEFEVEALWSALLVGAQCVVPEENPCCPGRNDHCFDPQAKCFRDDYCHTAGDCCPDVQFRCSSSHESLRKGAI